LVPDGRARTVEDFRILAGLRPWLEWAMGGCEEGRGHNLMHVVGTVTGMMRGSEAGVSNDTHTSTTDPDAQLYRKAAGQPNLAPAGPNERQQRR
jgi:hypothetical protein